VGNYKLPVIIVVIVISATATTPFFVDNPIREHFMGNFFHAGIVSSRLQY
jgi:hypothetical protein